MPYRYQSLKCLLALNISGKHDPSQAPLPPTIPTLKISNRYTENTFCRNRGLNHQGHKFTALSEPSALNFMLFILPPACKFENARHFSPTKQVSLGLHCLAMTHMACGCKKVVSATRVSLCPSPYSFAADTSESSTAMLSVKTPHNSTQENPPSQIHT